MRFVRTITGILLLAVGLPILLAGGTLWFVGRHRDAAGAFGANLERVETSGYAIVVPDLDALLRTEAPFVRTGSTRLRVTARLDGGPAFLGVAPAADVAAYLAEAPHARIERVRVTQGTLPVRTEPVAVDSSAAVGVPGDQLFWTGHGLGVLDLATPDLRSQELSLVIMRPDARPGLAVGVRAEVRPTWFDLTAGAALAGGTLLIVLAVVLVLWRPRPREVVFVIEPGQVSALAGRIGVTPPAAVTAGRSGNRRLPARLARRRVRRWHGVGRAVGKRSVRDAVARPARPVGEGLGQLARERSRQLSVSPRDTGERGEQGGPEVSPGERPRSAKVLLPTHGADRSRILPPWPELDAQARVRTMPARPTGARPATLAELAARSVLPARSGAVSSRDASASSIGGGTGDGGDGPGRGWPGVPLQQPAADAPAVEPRRIRPAVPVPLVDTD